MTFEITMTEHTQRLATLLIAGRITAASAPEVKERVKMLISSGHIDLIFELSKTTFIDSSGLSAIVSALKQVREREGSLKLACLHEDVQSIFKLTMLDRVFDLYPTVEAAKESEISR